ncbi:SH3 domain-containing protein [Lacinutrix mariniflava]|uniref:SH3 domain-containing protein n=1 Tax=Lacinutrix mariniflava TaxID=342955 RepID=UPI0006E18B99|nr:SH3 domain-containing protein [Lacinutrix mariniflava]
MNKIIVILIIIFIPLISLNAQESKVYERKINEEITYTLENGFALQKLGKQIFFREKPDETHQVISINELNEVIDSINLPNTSHGYSIKVMMKNELNFSQDILAYKEFRQSCPGGGSTTFISKNKNGIFSKLISSSYSTMGHSVIYFPIKFKDKGLLLISENDLNEQSERKPTTYKYPKDINIPVRELIIETNTEYLEDVEGLTEDEIIIKSITSNYFQWNGKELIKIKTVEHKKPVLSNKNITNYPKNGKAYVIAKNGLTYRKSPELKSTKYGAFDFGTEIIIIENSKIDLELTDNGKVLKGQWVKVKSKNNKKDKSLSFDGDYKYTGYVFNGFLIGTNKVDFRND